MCSVSTLFQNHPQGNMNRIFHEFTNFMVNSWNILFTWPLGWFWNCTSMIHEYVEGNWNLNISVMPWYTYHNWTRRVSQVISFHVLFLDYHCRHIMHHFRVHHFFRGQSGRQQLVFLEQYAQTKTLLGIQKWCWMHNFFKHVRVQARHYTYVNTFYTLSETKDEQNAKDTLTVYCVL